MKNPLDIQVPLGVVVGLVILSIPVVSLFGWVVQYNATRGSDAAGKIGAVAESIATFPDPLIRILLGDGGIQPQIQEFNEFSGLKIIDPEFEENGYLLVSSFSDHHGVTTVKLIDLKGREIIHEWVPPVEEINSATSITDGYNIRKNYRTQHPYLLEDGSLIFTSGEGPLARIDACSDLQWTIDRHFHHAIERASDGNFWVPHVIGPAVGGKVGPGLSDTPLPLREDGFAEVSPEGEILREWSILEIVNKLPDANHILFGIGRWEADRFHLNDAEPITRSDDFVEQGDILLSIRNLSIVLVYRPSTDEIVYVGAGPWLNQHDVDYQGGGRLTVFGNDVVRSSVGTVFVDGFNKIYSIDLGSGEAGLHRDLTDEAIDTASQGLHRVLENGDIFVEETGAPLLHRVGPGGLRWSYVPSLSDGTAGALHWSRYLTRTEIELGWLATIPCATDVPHNEARP